MADSTRHFAPSDRVPEKRRKLYTVRLTDSESEILERAAAKDGITPINLIRRALSEALDRPRKPRR